MEPRWKGLNTAVPVVMVSKRAYRSEVSRRLLFIFSLSRSILVAESYSGHRLSFVADKGDTPGGGGIKSIRSSTWEPLEKLSKGEVRVKSRSSLCRVV